MVLQPTVVSSMGSDALGNDSIDDIQIFDVYKELTLGKMCC